jgi:hypothetical protein
MNEMVFLQRKYMNGGGSTPEEYVTLVILPFLNPSLYRLFIDFSIYKNKYSCKKHQLKY